MDYQKALAFMERFPDMERGSAPSNSLSMSLDTMKSLLRRLGDPQLGRNTIHITGSKGKGSVATMLSAILSRAGHKVSTYTSPHLHSYTERIAFNCAPISEFEFASGMQAISEAVNAEANSGNALSVFGLLTALFFHLSSEQRAQWQVVEVGLGGEDDATNVFKTKEAAVITAISLEHTAILGTTRAEIARRKAGIVSPNCEAVLAPQKDPSAQAEVLRRCESVGARFWDASFARARIGKLEELSRSQRFAFSSNGSTLDFEIPLLGRHQIDNVATTLMTVGALRERGHAIADRAIVEGLRAAEIAGRMEIVCDAPTIVLDGAHNGESAAALASALKSLLGKGRHSECILVVGMNSDKDVEGFLGEFSNLADSVISCRADNKRAMDPARIALAAEKICASSASDSVESAVDAALKRAPDDALICITGSLYVVGEGRNWLLKRRIPSGELTTASANNFA